jgi:hypothetical protein
MSTTSNLTTRAFERSNPGQTPKGRGGWLFQATRTSMAFDDDLFGEMVCFSGTFTEARKAAARHFGGQMFAVLP